MEEVSSLSQNLADQIISTLEESINFEDLKKTDNKSFEIGGSSNNSIKQMEEMINKSKEYLYGYYKDIRLEDFGSSLEKLTVEIGELNRHLDMSYQEIKEFF